MTLELPAPDEARVSAFWDLAKRRARLGSLPGYFGPTALESLPPPTWAFGSTPEEADEFVGRALAESSASTSTALSDYEAIGEPLPETGSLSILLDGAGAPRALLATTDVRIEPGVGPGDEADVVVERFAVVYRD